MKVNSHIFPISILHRRPKGCVYTAQPTLINNCDFVGPQIYLETSLVDKPRAGTRHAIKVSVYWPTVDLS